QTLRTFITASGAELVRAMAPGLPVAPDPRTFVLLRASTATARWVTVVDWAEADSADAITALSVESDRIRLLTSGAEFVYQFPQSALERRHATQRAQLGGLRPAP